MPARPARHRRVPTCDPLEARDPAAGLGLAASAPAVARTAALAYRAGQLAYTGHTSVLLGTVRVTQPYPLKALRGHHPHPFARPRSPADAPPRVRFQRPF